MNLAATLGLWVAVVTAFAALLGFARLARIRIGFLALSLLLLGGYAWVVVKGFLPLETYFGDLDWNWDGKILAFAIMAAATLAASVTTRGAFAKQIGATLRQNPGSVAPSLLLIAAMMAPWVAGNAFDGQPPSYTTEELWFQAIMPGLDEEPFFRGILLLTLGCALKSGRVNILGAPIGWNGVCIALIFGMMHGLAWADGALVVNASAIAMTGAIGFGLVWVRERTGSLVLPILGHNAINLFQRFF